MKTKLLLIFLIVISLFVFGCKVEVTPGEEIVRPQFPIAQGELMKADGMVRSVPLANSVLTVLPGRVIIEAESDLLPTSTMSIYYDEIQEADKGVEIEGEFIGALMDSQYGSGEYRIVYTLCFEDSCSDGQFYFTYLTQEELLTQIENEGYEIVDKTGFEFVDILVKENSFEPNYFKVSKGATVQWFNEKNITHIISSDFLGGALGIMEIENEAVTINLNELGSYPYYCKTHEATGRIFVVDEPIVKEFEGEE